jgi:hypothetical protein
VNLASVSRGSVARAAGAFLLGLAIAACSTAAPNVSPTRAPGSSIAPTGDGGSTPEPPTSLAPPPSPTADDAAPLVIDPARLAVLPASIDGVPVTESPDDAALALTDPALPRIASALDVAVAVDLANGNLVTAWVVQLKPDALSDEAYRQWRDSYDEGACAAADGVIGHAEADIGGRKSYVTSCATGLRTYHVLLEDQDILVSASAIGEGRFGEKLLGGLRVPEPSPS